MAKYADNSDSDRIRACYNSIPAQLAKDNKKFQYKVVQKGGTAVIFGASIEWLNLARIVLKCQKVNEANKPSYSIRFSMKNFGEANGIKAIPLYAVFCV